MPAPRGQPGRAAARDDHRLLVRQLCRRRHAGAGRRRPARASGERIRMMASDAVYSADQLGVFTPKAVPRDELAAGEVGFLIAGIKELQAAQGRRHDHGREEAAQQRRRRDRAAARLQGDPAAGLRRPVSDRGERVRPAARRAGEAQAQRLVAALRARGEPGARLRLSLRLPRPAAHGDRAGAARARVRPGPDHDGAVGGLRGAAQRRRGASGSRTRRKMPDLGRIAEIREPIVTVHLYMPQEYVGPVMTLANQKRGNQINMAYHGTPGACSPTRCRWPRSCSTSSTS